MKFRRSQVAVLAVWLVALSGSLAADEEIPPKQSKNETSSDAKGRVFSLFSIVTFKNTACTSTTDSTMKGTCYTSSECQSKGGTSGGNCAAGFGVCCMFMVTTCGSSVTQNCSYVQNPSYPSSYTPVSTTCSYTVAPVQSDICQLRLDFTNFVTLVSAGACVDSFVVTTPGGITYPTICGTNSNQHMYVDTGSSTASSTLAFTIGSTTSTRTWKIKISQIECSNPGKAPDGCLQFFTGITGTVKSYNYAGAQMLPSQQYTNCFRQEQGYCLIEYSETATTSPDPFQLVPTAIAAITATSAALIGHACTVTNSLAYIVIPTDISGSVMFCGSYLSTISLNTTPGIVRDITSPFTMNVFSYATAAPTTIGFSLVYNQVPCN